MSRGTTIFLVALALALAVFAAIFIPLHDVGGKPPGSPLFDFDPDELRSIKITNGDNVFELKKSAGGWTIRPEPADRASVDAVKRLIETARDTPVVDRIDGSEIADRGQLSEYGLKKSSVQLDFKGDRDHSLLFGKDAADERLVYVRFEDARDVYLIPDELLRLVLSPAQDFRDRMPVRLRPDRVARLVIRRPSGEIELKREAGGWAIVKPLSARASATAVEAFLEKLFRTRIEGFEAAADPAAFGLAEPVAEVLAFGEGEPEPETIRVGMAVSGGGYYARLIPRQVTVRLPASIMDQLAVDPTTFRDPSLVRINLDLVDMIRIASGGRSFEIRRNGDGWKIGDKNASKAAVERMADAFALAKATRYEPATGPVLARTGLADPPLAVGFYSVLSENTPEEQAGEHLIAEFRFGAQADDLPVHAKGAAEVAFTAAPLLKAIPADPAAWVAP
ncbi:MAG: DUF4340 domain-containing protein [Verrucomicrobiae bacterium]